MGAITKTLYETDFAEWAFHTAELLRRGDFQDVDIENLVEEMESLGRSQRTSVQSQMRRLLVHVLKQRIQPERSSTSWRISIVNARKELMDFIEASPSLRRHLATSLPKIYRDAIDVALEETQLAERAGELDLAEECPYSVAELLEGDLKMLGGV